MPQPCFRFETDVSGEGTVTLKIPLPPGTPVEVAVLVLHSEEFDDPVNAASSALPAQVLRLQGELDELREEKRLLMKSLAALMLKGEPEHMDITPEDGVCEPSIVQLIEELEKST